jgi:hypothetical protein
MAACFGLWEHLCHDGEVMRDVERRSSKMQTMSRIAASTSICDATFGGRDAIRAWAEETGASELGSGYAKPHSPTRRL